MPDGGDLGGEYLEWEVRGFPFMNQFGKRFPFRVFSVFRGSDS